MKTNNPKAHSFFRRTFICLLALSCVLVSFRKTIHAQAASAPEPISVTVLYLNDVSEFTPLDRGRTGSLARVSSLRKEIKERWPNTIFVLAGNTLSPSPLSGLYYGGQMIDAWNTVGLDLAAVGERDFDFGLGALRSRILDSRFRWLGTNILENGKPLTGAFPYQIRDFSGAKVGFFSLITDRFPRSPDIKIQPPAQAARESVKALRSQGATVVIALSSMSLEEDLKIVNETEGIDVLLGAQANSLTQVIGGRTPILKTSGNARELGQLNLNFDPQTKKLQSIDYRTLPVTSAVASDPQFSVIYQKYSTDLSTFALAAVRTSVALDGTRVSNTSRETNAGNFVADALRSVAESDVAIINGGAVGSNRILLPGLLTRGDLFSLLPAGGALIKFRVTGETLQQLLEFGVSETGQQAITVGIFPQVSGLSFTYDPTRPANTRIRTVLINGKPINKSQKYTVATTSTITNPRGPYGSFLTAGNSIPTAKKYSTADVLSIAILQTKEISPKVENRIGISSF